MRLSKGEKEALFRLLQDAPEVKSYESEDEYERYITSVFLKLRLELKGY